MTREQLKQRIALIIWDKIRLYYTHPYMSFEDAQKTEEFELWCDLFLDGAIFGIELIGDKTKKPC